jgi:hypothetical protein
MKILFFIGLMLFWFSTSYAAQKAKIISPNVDVYSDADFDSDILETVKLGETYLISNKVYGPFFRIKLKSGKIGYIPDTEVDIEGKGRVVPATKEKDEDDYSDDPFLNDMDSPFKKNKKSERNTDDEEDEDLRGITLQLVNYHEDTLGAVQVDDLPAIGYKSISDFAAWEVIASFKSPKYYSDKLNASTRAINIWGTFGLSSEVPLLPSWSARYGGGLMGHASFVNITAPQKSYEMQDLTVGAYLEGAVLVRIAKLRYDLSIKYIFDKQSYGALGFTLFW